MVKDVLLIVHDVYQDNNEFPSNVGYLASMLENRGFSVEVYCMDVYHYTNRQLVDKLDNNDYKVIGISFLAARFIETVLPLCKLINKYKGDALLVLGGHGASPIPEYMLRKTVADIIVIGEGEETICEIVDNLKNNNVIDESINGIAYLDNDKFIQTKERKPIRRLDDIPMPAYHLFPIDIYSTCKKIPGMVKGDKLLSIITSRGCVNSCTFCYRMIESVRLRSIDNVMKEIKYLYDTYGINSYNMNDELFLISKKRLKKFVDALDEYGLKIKYTANVRADIFDKEMARLLKKSGCTLANIGFESMSQNILDEMKKNTTVEDNTKALDISISEDIPVGLNFIWGFPSDNKKTLMKRVDTIKKYNKYQQMRTIRPVTPYPGCELYYYAIDKGLLDGPEDFFNKFKNSDLITINFTQYPNKLCYKWLLEGNKELIYDYYKNTNGDMIDADGLINDFKMLYKGKLNKFRGSKNYTKNINNTTN